MRIFAAGLGTETNTFAPFPTSRASFEVCEYFPPGTHPDAPSFMGAPLWVARRRAKANNWHVVEGLCAMAEPAGITIRAAYEELRDEILAQLKAAMPVDMVALGMHGAMVAEGYDDCEGDLLTRVRALVGPDVAVGAELDLHCHITDQMVESADVLIAYKEYPHTDVTARAEELIDLLARTAAGEIRPHMSLHDCAMIGIMHTPREPVRSFVDRAAAMEGKGGVLSVSIGHGFPWGDVADMGSRILVVTDGDADRGDRVARSLGQELFAMREDTAPRMLSIDEALDLAAAASEGPIVMADVSDNAGGGAPGDSTYLIEAIRRRGLTDVALGPLWDPIAVATCFDAGEGANLPLRFGGKMCPLSGDPVDADVTVTALARDAVQHLGDTPATLGDCAAIRFDGIDVVLNSTRTQAYSPDLFTAVGIDPARRHIVVVKSTQHFYAGFAPLAAQIVYVAAPGVVAPDFTNLDFRKIKRPKWPFDGVDTAPMSAAAEMN